MGISFDGWDSFEEQGEEESNDKKSLNVHGGKFTNEICSCLDEQCEKSNEEENEGNSVQCAIDVSEYQTVPLDVDTTEFMQDLHWSIPIHRNHLLQFWLGFSPVLLGGWGPQGPCPSPHQIDCFVVLQANHTGFIPR